MTNDITPAELAAAQKALGLSDSGFASLVGVTDGSTVRRWKRGDRDIPGPVVVLVKAVMGSAAVREYFGLTLAE